MKTLVAVAAFSALLAVPALAQTENPAPKTEATPPAGAARAAGMFYFERDEWRASKLIGLMGARVSNTAGETIGDINDVLIDKDGKVAAVVIGVGAFLGMGERHAAVSFDWLQLTRDSDGNPLLRVNLTKDQLESAPEWKRQPASVN
jgi:sporulation protein YlmC with PRC-barrel domain